jgi:hypothetical protein
MIKENTTGLGRIKKTAIFAVRKNEVSQNKEK